MASVLPFTIPPAPLHAQDIRLDHPGVAAGRLIALCGDSSHPDVRTRERQIAVLEDAIHRGDQGAATLHALVCQSSLRFAEVTGNSHGDTLTRARYLSDAISTVTRIAEGSPDDSLAVAAFGILALELENGNDPLAAITRARRIGDVAYAGVRFGTTAPPALRACVDYSMVVADFATAHYCSARALTIGADSSWQLIRLAWMAAVTGDSSVVPLFDRAIATAHEGAARDDAAWYAFWLRDSTSRTPASLAAAWQRLDDANRVRWVHEHLPTISVPDSVRYRTLLAAVLADPGIHGTMYHLCPPEVIQNGHRKEIDRTACRSVGVPIEVNAQLVRLWNPVSQTPEAVIGFALRGRSIITDQTSSIGRKADVTFDLRQWDAVASQWSDSVVRRAVRIPNDLLADYTHGSFAVPWVGGSDSWTLWAGQGARNGSWSVADQPPIDSGRTSISDLVIGARDQDVMVQIGNDSVYLAPEAILHHGKPIELYYQVHATAALPSLTATVVLHAIVNGMISAESELSLSLKKDLRPGINVTQTRVDISRLGIGDHKLEVRLTDPSGRLLLTRSIDLLIR